MEHADVAQQLDQQVVQRIGLGTPCSHRHFPSLQSCAIQLLAVR
jgi:hypothetical protein